MTPLPDLVAGSLRYARDQSEDNFWAWEEVDDLVRSQPEIGWTVVLALVEQAPTPAALAFVAAGRPGQSLQA